MALNTKHTYLNRFYAHLRTAISDSATSINLYPEEITNLLSGWQAGTWLYLCIVDIQGHREIVKVTALSGYENSLTIDRGQGGTTARSWEAGSLVASRAVAEYLTRYLQKGVFRTGAYNPNDTLTGDYTGEKFYQTGPNVLQRRWWMNTKTNRWRLLTGEIYTGETLDAESYIMPPPAEWVQVSDQIPAGLRSVATYNSKIYCADGDGVLYEWNGVDTLTVVATTVGDAIIDLIEFNSKLYGLSSGGQLYEWNDVDAWASKSAASSSECLGVHSGSLFCSGSDGKLRQWNGVNAWVEVAAKVQDGIARLISFSGTLYGLTYFIFLGTGGRLFNWTGAAWGEVAAKYSDERYGRVVVEHDGKVYAGVGTNEGDLVEWNGVDAWTLRAQANPLAGGGEILNLASLDGVLYVQAYDATLATTGTYIWDGVSYLEWLCDLPIAAGAIPETGFWNWVVLGSSVYASGAMGYLWKLTP